MPSGTAYRQVAVLNQEAHSLFEIMVENKSLALEQMLREFILPFIKRKWILQKKYQQVLIHLVYIK